MRRYKLAIYILVILSVFNFVPVLAAPIPMRRVREVCADAVGGGGGAIILSGKRAEEGEDPSSEYRESTRASPDSGSMSDQLSTLSQYPRGSPPTSDYASGTHQETTNPIQLRSSAPRDSGMTPSEPGGTGLPWNSGGLRKPPYASGSTELPWESPNKVQPTSVRTKVPGTGPTPWDSLWDSPGDLRKPPYASGGIQRPSYPSGGTGLPWISHNKVQPTSVRTKVSGTGPTSPWDSLWDSPGDMRRPPYASGGIRKPSSYPSGGTELPWISHNKVQPTSVRTKVVPGTGPTSSSSGRIVPASSLPQSKSFWSGLVSNSKSLFRKPFWRRRVQFTPKP